jgi:predicted enzyme related to lactoylglutathione lyase
MQITGRTQPAEQERKMSETATESRPETSPAAKYNFQLGFFKLVVRDLDAMTAFYRDAFGLRLGDRLTGPDFEEVLLAAPASPMTLILYRWTDDREIVIGSGHGPAGFVTTDIDGGFAHALSLGATVIQPPTDVPGLRVAMLRDPEGHEIELVQFQSPEGAA